MEAEKWFHHDGAVTELATFPRAPARISELDPQILLSWMRRQPGDISARRIGENGPRPFRHRAERDPALAALIEAGEIELVSSKPRAYRVVGHGTRSEALEDRQAGEDATLAEGAVANNEVRRRFDQALARHANRGLSKPALIYKAGRVVHDDLRRDPRLAWPQLNPSRCVYCAEWDDMTFLHVAHGRLVHARCFGRYRAAIAEQVDEMIVDAIGNR